MNYKILRTKGRDDQDHSKRTVWHQRISVRTALLVWGLIIFTLMIFIFGTLPSQKKILVDRMKSEANDIAGSIGQVTATAIINNDYGFTVEHCLKIIKQSNSIVYIIITRNDGFSLVHVADKWHMDNLKVEGNSAGRKIARGSFKFSSLANQEVFDYSYPFSYSGIEWGTITVGLSLKRYNQGLSDLYSRTLFLALLSIVAGFAVSLYFTRKLTKPILELDTVSQKVASGDLNARVKIESENELGRLAQSFNRMTESLKNSQDILEKKVEERTAELRKINQVLQVEISEKLLAESRLRQYNNRLESLDEIYRGIISAISIEKIIIKTIDNLRKLFVTGKKNYIVLYENKTDKAQIFSSAYCDDASVQNNVLKYEGDKEIYSYEARYENIYCNDNLNVTDRITILENKLFEDNIRSFILTPLVMEEEYIGMIIIGSDKPDSFDDESKDVLPVIAKQLAVAIYQARLQERISEHAQSLQNSLSEKEVLLKEIHHRVKNNLQVISSLLYLGSKKIKDRDTLEMFKDSQNRVKSIALVHERLYQSKDLDKIDFKQYVIKLTEDLYRSYGVGSSEISLKINFDDIIIDIDTGVPCGLIINELISNSFKYAFPDRYEKECQIQIDFSYMEDGRLQLVISDNGVGIPESLDIRKTNSLGLQLVETLVEQLDGTLEISRKGGTAFFIRFRENHAK